jgi:hypothetical protein
MKPSEKLAGLAILGIGVAAFFKRDRLVEQLPAKGNIIEAIISGDAMTRGDVRSIIRSHAKAAGFDPDWFDAIAKHESHWRLDAVNNAGPDAKYGGSYGPMQMLKTNIERLGFTIEDVTTDANKAAQAAVKLMQEGNPKSFEDAVAWWNAGKKDQDLVSPFSSEQIYLAEAIQDLDWVKFNPPA